MRIVSGILLVCMLGLLTGMCLAAPGAPPDEKEWHYIMQNGTRATYPEAEPNDTCPTAMEVQCGDVIDPASIASGTDLDWYVIRNVTVGTVITAGTDAGTLCGSPFVTDSYIELWYNCGAARVAYDDDSGPGLYSLLTYTVPAGAAGDYMVKVRGYSSSYTGCYKFFVDCSVPQPPPANDTCAGAIDIPRCTSGVINGDCTWATNDYSLPSGTASCTGYTTAGKDVVYSMNLVAGDHVDMDYINVADGALYFITDCANPATSCVIGQDSTVTNGHEIIHWACPTTGLYYVICDNYTSNGGGLFTLTYNIVCSEPQGACCTPGGACTMTNEANCQSPNIWHPEWNSCSPENPCPQPVGACCAPDGSCTVTTAGGCLVPSIWHGEWIDCTVAQCPQPPTGACCNHATGACAITTQANCAFEWLGSGVPCNTQTCPPPVPVGACCNQATGECAMTTQADCLFVWLGADVPCNPTTCPPPAPTGACCNQATGECSLTTQADCPFAWLGENIPCSVTTCPPPPPMGACCDRATGACTLTTELDCHFVWLGENAPCTVTTCPPPPPLGACCVPGTGVCTMRTQADCQLPLVWHAGMSCTPTNPCPVVPIERSTWGKIKKTYR